MKRVVNSLKNHVRRLEALVNRHSAYKFFIRDWVALGDLKAASQVVNTLRFSRNLEPIEMAVPDAQRIIVIAPHPDDEMIGPGGTLIQALECNAIIQVIYLTSGGEAEQLVREQEANRVGDQFGFERIFLRHPPLAIPDDPETLSRLGALIAEFRPDALFVPFVLDDHDDHRRASHILVKLVLEQLLDMSLTVWAYQVYSAVLTNVVVDIGATRERKADAIRLYTSQMKTRDWANFAIGLNAWNSRLLPDCPDAAFAEAFLVLPLGEYVKFAQGYFERAADKAYYLSEYQSDQ